VPVSVDVEPFSRCSGASEQQEADGVPRIRRDVAFWGTTKASTSRFLPGGKPAAGKANGKAKVKVKIHPRAELRQSLENTLRTKPQASLPELVATANQWLEQKRRMGGDTWPRSYGEPFVVRVLSEIPGPPGERFREDPRVERPRRQTVRVKVKRGARKAASKAREPAKGRKGRPAAQKKQTAAPPPPPTAPTPAAIAGGPVVELAPVAERKQDKLLVRWAACTSVRRVRVDVLTAEGSRLRRTKVSPPATEVTFGKMEDVPADVVVRLIGTGEGGTVLADVEVPISGATSAA